MASILNASVLSTAGRLSGRNCSEIPFRLPPEVLLKREILWEKMQKKYELLEQNSVNHEYVCVNSIGTHLVWSMSSCCDGMLMQSTDTELPGADGSWEDRKKYRKSKDLVQHWVNTSGHGLVHESSDQFFPVLTQQVEMSLSVAGRELASCDDLPDVTSCFQESQNNCESCSNSILKEFKNVDGTPGYSADDTHHELDHVVLMTQEEHPTKQTRSIAKSPKGCSKIPDSESETLFTDKKSSRTRSDFVSFNKTPISKKEILKPVSKDTSSPKEISVRSCNQIGTLINGELATGKEISVPRIERVLRNYNDSSTVRKEDHSVEDTKCTDKQVLENCGTEPTAVNTVLMAPEPVPTPDAGAKCTNNLISGKRTLFSSGTEVLESSNGSICKKGNLPIIKGVPSCGKETLTHNDMTGRMKRKRLFDPEDGKTISGPNQSLLKEKPVSGYRLEKDIDNCDTDPTLRRDMFLSKTVAPASGTESGMGRCCRGRKKSPFNDADSSLSGTRRNAHSYSKVATAGKTEVGSRVCYTTASGAETNVGNFYTISSIKKECALIYRTEVNRRDYNGDPTVRKKRILAMDEQDSSSTTGEILKDVDCGSLSLKDKVSGEDGETLESVKGVRNDKKKQCAAAGRLVNNEVRDQLDRRKCHNVNPAPTIEHICEENVTSRRVNLQNSKSPESYVQIKGKENFASASVSLPISDEDCVEHSLEDASTVIIYPLLSCKYENEVSKVRHKLNKMCENVKNKDRGPLVNHVTGRAGHNYNCCPERRVFQWKRKNRRSTWSSDVVQDRLSYLETLSQCGSDKSSGCLGLKGKSVYPVVLADKGTSELLGDTQDKTYDAEYEDRTKDVSKCTPSHSEKQDIINDNCDKICSFGSQSISCSNKNSKESPERFGTPQQFGRNKVMHSHCNCDAEGHGFEINRIGKKETSHLSVKSDDENKEEITDDDDDDIFCYRQSQCSSLHYGKENKRINKTFCLNSQSRSVRHASDDTVSRLSVTYEHRRNTRTAFSNARSHSSTQTPHDGANMTKENVLMTRTKRTKSLNHSATSGYAESEDYETGDNENSTKRNAITQRKIKIETSRNFRGSHCAKYDSGNLEKVNVLTRDNSSTAASNHVGSGRGENGDVRADDRSCIFSDSYDGGDSLEKEYITPIWKCGRKSSNYLCGSGHEKNESVIVDCGKNPNNGNVVTGRKRQTVSLYNSGGQEQGENGDHIINDDNPKKDVFYKRKRRKNISDCSISSGVDDDKHGITNDGKMPNRTNVITNRKQQAKALNNSVESKQDETEHNRSHDGSHIKRGNMSHRRKGTNSSGHLIASDRVKNENQIIDNGKCPDSENHLTRSKRGMKVHNSSVIFKNSENEDDITDNRREPNKGNVLNGRERGTGTTSYHLSDSEHNTNEVITDKRVLFSDDGSNSKKENIFNRIKRTGTPKHHGKNDDDDDDDDSIFYKTPKHSWFNDTEKPDSTFGNRHSTFVESSSSNTCASVTSSHSQMLLTRSNVTKERRQHSVKPVSSENEDMVNNVSSSDETSTGIEDLYTDSYKRQISGDVMKQFPSNDKSYDSLHRIKTDSKLMKKRRAETRTGLPTGAELLESEKEVACDILYTPTKNLLFHEKKKEGWVIFITK